MDKKKCTNCGCEQLKLISISGPTDDGFFDLSQARADMEKEIEIYCCTKCGHIEMYVKLNKQ